MAVGMDADECHGANAHHEGICDRHHFEITKLDKSVISLANHARRDVEFLGDLGEGFPAIFPHGIDNVLIYIVETTGRGITDYALHWFILFLFCTKVNEFITIDYKIIVFSNAYELSF
jgi:hypothetical protein